MDEDPNMLFSHVTQVEELAEEILADRQQIVDLDRKRHRTREAIRALKKHNPTEKTWVCFGNMFIKMPAKKTTTLLNKDFDHLDEEINTVRVNLKPKVTRLRDLEHKEDVKGFTLHALTKEELASVTEVL